MNISLNDILVYENPPVVNRFKKDFPQMAHEAETVFKDLLRFFWATELHRVERTQSPHNPNYNFLFIMDEEMKPIDQMWHIFLLYTKDYMEFCERYFKQYIHHVPDIVPDLPQDEAAFAVNLERFLRFTYDRLGAETVKRWFND
jgi:hypothetical protein